jgi:exopolysaccharide production protein ExoQ
MTTKLSPSGRPRPLLFAYLLIFSNSFYYAFSSFEGGFHSAKSGDSVLYQIIIGSAYALLSLKLLTSWTRAVVTLSQSIAFLLFIASSIISYILVGAEIISLLRFSMYIGTLLLGLFVAYSYRADDVYTTLFWALGFILLIHFSLFPFLFDKIVYDYNEGRTNIVGTLSYGGLFPHKTTAGEVFALSAIIAFPRCFQPTARLTARLVFVGSLTAIILAGAVGPLISLLLVFAIGYEIYSFRKHPVIAFLALLVAILSIFLFYLFGASQVLAFFGRSTDLTGRDILLELWPSLFVEHPLFGYGFNGIFSGAPGAPEERLMDIIPGAKFSTFESLYLEILIQFGLIGGLIFLFIVLKAASNAFAALNHETSQTNYIPISILMFMLISGFVEASVTAQNSLEPFLLFWIYFGCGRKFRSQRPSCASTDRVDGGSRRSVISAKQESIG